MSYDLYLQIDTGGEHPATVYDVGNYTSNVSGMWAEALGYPLADLHGRTAADAIPDLRAAIRRMGDDPGMYRAMEPANGWGNAEGARGYLARLLDGCEANPKSAIYVSR
jgi:hypothetical protein